MPDHHEEFRRELELFQAESENFAVTAIRDSNARKTYIQLIRQVAVDLAAKVEAGALTPHEAALLAREGRQEVLEYARGKSSPFGKAMAKQMKATSPSFEQLSTKYAEKLFKSPFEKLTATQQNKVFLEIVEAAGRDNAKVTKWMARAGKAGRGFALVSIGIAFYNIQTATDKPRAIAKEGATFLGGVGGGMAAGAVVGMWCGPVGVGIGMFVGGILGAIGTDMAFDALWEASPEQKFQNQLPTPKPSPGPTPTPRPTPAPKTASIPRYKVQAGDSLSKLAATIYGDGNRWTLLFQANSHQITHPKKWLDRGQVLLIPAPSPNHPEAQKKWQEWQSKKYEPSRAYDSPNYQSPVPQPVPGPTPTPSPSAPGGSKGGAALAVG